MKRTTYNSKVAATFGRRARNGPYVGIELEFEGASVHRLTTGQMPNWTVDSDHSLRGGGIEFISKPLQPSALDLALDEVAQQIAQCGAKVNKRCGTHIHLNVGDLTFRELWSVLTYYALVEPFVFKEFADGREDSHFCVPTWANTALQKHLYTDATALYRGIAPINGNGDLGPGYAALAHKPKQFMFLNNAKYSAMNMTSLARFGTLEFRQARGTKSMLFVKRWAKFLMRLRHEARKFKTADDVIIEYEQNGYRQLCSRVGLPQSRTVNPEDLSDAVDGAFLLVGHPPTNHKTLNWEIK